MPAGRICRVSSRARAQPAVARTSFERAIKLNDGYLPARMALAGELLAGNDIDKARTLLEQALATQGNQPALRAVLGDIAYRQQRYPQAIEQLNEALRLDPQANSINAALARVHEAAGNAEAARAAQAKAGDVPPLLDDPLMQRIVPAVDTRSAQAPVATDPVQLAIGEANFLAAAGNYAAARAALDKAVRTTPNNAILLANYARIEIAAGNLEAARSRARAAVGADPKSVQAWIIQAVVLEIANDDNAAIDAYRRALAADPKAVRAHIGLGNIAMRTGKPSDAVAAYRAVVTSAPDNTEAWARLLAAQSVVGQCAAAVREANDNAARQKDNPLFAELRIRAVSTCPAATAAQKQAVLLEGQKLYTATNENLAQISEAYALALAANGKWEDAAQTQGAAVYEAVRAGDQIAVAQYREFYQRLQAKQMPAHPWPDSHPLIKPQRPSLPARAPAAKPAG